METLRRQLEEEIEEAALVGDDISAECLHLRLRNVESLQLSLPRHILTSKDAEEPKEFFKVLGAKQWLRTQWRSENMFAPHSFHR